MVRLLKRAVQFVSASPFINPSRAPTSLIEMHNGRYVIGKARSQNAVFLMTGIVTECALIKPTTSWSSLGSPAKMIKRIKIRPFSVEYERAAAYFATFLNTHGASEFGGPIYNNGVGFTTRKEGSNAGKLISKPTWSCALALSSQLRPLHHYPLTNCFLRRRLRELLMLRNIETKQLSKRDRQTSCSRRARRSRTTVCGTCSWAILVLLTVFISVPIYDARKEKRFNFSLTDLQEISKLPRFKHGNTDLPAEEYVATVGFTVGSFMSSAANSQVKARISIAMNIMFVILLGRIQVENV